MSLIFRTMKQCAINNRMYYKCSRIVLHKRTNHLLHRNVCKLSNNKVDTNHKLKQLNDRIYCTSVDEDLLEDIQVSDTLMTDLDSELDDKGSFRCFLYPESNDPIIEQLQNSSTIQDVFNIIKEHSDLKHNHVCQSILTLWDLQKAYKVCYLLNLDKLDVNFCLEEMINEYVNKMQAHPEFNKLLNLVDEHASCFNPLELSCVLYNLRKMGLSLDIEIIDKLIGLVHENIQSNIDEWCLKSLSLFTSSFEPKDNLRFVYLTKDLLPFFIDAIESCDSPRDFELITIAMHNLHILISKTILSIYITRLKEIVQAEDFSHDHLKMLTRALTFLNLPHWSRDNSKDIEHLSQYFRDKIHLLKVPELISLQKTCHFQSTPGYLREPIKMQGLHHLKDSRSDSRISTFMKQPDLMLCQVTSSSSESKVFVEKMVNNYIQHSLPSMLFTTYKLLKHLKYPNSNISEMFWCKVLEIVMRDDMPDYILLRIIHRYMYFNNNLGNSHRCFVFEQAIFSKFTQLSDNYIYHIPWKFSKLFAFLIAYGFDRKHLIDIKVYEKHLQLLEGMKNQLDSMDWLILARGLKLSKIIDVLPNYDPRKRILLLVDRLVNESITKFANCNLNSTFDEICINMKVYLYRHSKCDSEDFYKIISKLETNTEELTARSIRDVIINVYPSNIILPKLFEDVCDYISEKGENLYGEVMQRILYLFYTLGYTPKNSTFFDTAIDVIQRDKDILNCLTLLQCYQALCFFGKFPEALVRDVFSIDFMEKIDKEVESCYLKVKYPMRIRENLMLLNRAVCLELPEYDVPWFHEKYIKGKQSLASQSSSVIYDDVLGALMKVLGSKEAIQLKHTSPYGYNVDFLVKLDSRNRPVQKNRGHDRNHNYKKVAISLIESKSFSRYCHISNGSPSTLRLQLVPNGSVLCRRRHLELMGYKVMDIHPSLWNSMHMAEPEEKVKYLHRNIFDNS